jgi:hypothetical protein
MPTPSPRPDRHADPAADLDRRRALEALAALPPAARRFLEALHAQHFPPRAGGGMAYRLADVLFHLAQGERFGFGDDRIAKALSVPVDYLRALRQAAGLQPAGEGR